MDSSTNSTLYLSWGPTILWGFVWYFIPAVASAYFAFKDASKQRALALNIPPLVWVLLCIPSGVLGLLAYWLMHYSSLAKSSTHDEKL